MDEEYITLKQAARQAGYHGPETLHLAVRQGRLKAVKPAGSVLLTTRAWLADYQSLVQANQSHRTHRAPAGADNEDGESAMADAEELVTGSEAARLAGVPRSRIDSWIKGGTLPTQPGDAHGRRVSLAVVRALAESTNPPPYRGPAVPPPGMEEYVPPSVAARVAGVKIGTVSYWGKRGKVATCPGPYGQLVRLADVLAVAAQSPVHRAGNKAIE